MSSRTLKATDPDAKPLEALRVANEEQTEAARAKRRPAAASKPAPKPATPAASAAKPEE